MSTPPQYFRAGVGCVVLDARGLVLVLERSDVAGAWQFPQGGLNAGEEPLTGAWRELGEETGLTDRDVTLLRPYPEPLVYELPPAARSAKTGLGQVQYWFFFRCRGEQVPIRLPAKGEFTQSTWRSFGDAVAGAAPFRRRVYERLQAFAGGEGLL